MSYSIVNYSDTTLKLTEGTKELIYKKAYCSTKVDGDYLIFSTHQLETGLGKQQYAILYSDCSSPSVASATLLKTAVDAIINSYAGADEVLYYKALVSQSGTDDPTVIELINTTGYTFTNEYVGEGLYRLSPSTDLDPTKTIVIAGSSFVGIFVNAWVDFEDVPGSIYISVYSSSSGMAVDSQLSNSSLIVEIHP